MNRTEKLIIMQAKRTRLTLYFVATYVGAAIIISFLFPLAGLIIGPGFFLIALWINRDIGRVKKEIKTLFTEKERRPFE